jgi:fatty acid desaturase
VVGLVHGNLLIGLSFGWWTGKHNRHHAYPNQAGKDPGIAIGAIAFTPDQARGRRGPARVLAPYQAYLFFPMLLVEAVSMHAISVRAVLNGPVRRRWLEGLLLFAHCAGLRPPPQAAGGASAGPAARCAQARNEDQATSG